MANGRKTGGRVAGTPNKFSADLRAMVLNALSEAGGEQYLTRQANENPGAFMTLLGKILPTQVTGDEGGPVTYTFHWADAALAPEPEPIAEVGDANDAGNTEIAETWATC